MEPPATETAAITNCNYYVILKSFLTTTEQKQLVRDALLCHARHAPKHQDVNCGHANCDGITETKNMKSNPSAESCKCHWLGMDKQLSSKKFHLGIDCGGSLDTTLPFSVVLARRAFRLASKELPNVKSLDSLSISENNNIEEEHEQNEQAPQECVPLTGLALLYGPNSYMKPHYDSPTQPMQKEEWLVMMSIGNAVIFRCNENLITLVSGDAIVMDSMAVLHGVEEIVPSQLSQSVQNELPVKGSRLGVLLWQGRMKASNNSPENQGVNLQVDGVSNLFAGDEDE